MPTPQFIREARAKIGNALLHVPTVAVLAHDDQGRLLLVQDVHDGTWTCPGGIVEPYEVLADAAVREAWEESGIHVELIEILGVYSGEHCITVYPNGDQLSWVATIFSARAIGGSLSADQQETTSARFFAKSELEQLNLKEHLQWFLAMAESGKSGHFAPATWHPQDE